METIINQPWEDVASDVTGAIEKAVQPLLKRAVDEIYSGLLDTTQDYLRDNLAFNIASRIDAAEREAARDRIVARDLLAACVQAEAHLVELYRAISPKSEGRHADQDVSVQQLRAAIAKARGEA